MKESNHIERNPKELYRDTNLQILFSVTLMAVMGVSSITPAFPKIGQELGLSPQELGLLITVFTFPGILLAPILGILADRLGRKKILVPLLMLFGVAGGACAFTRNYDLLLALRFFQGVGASSLGALNVTILGDLYSGKERVAVMGYNASVLGVATAGYPAVGGAMATLGWYYPFALPFIAVPVGLVVLFWLKNPEPDSHQDFKEYLISASRYIRTRQVLGLFLASVITFVVLYGSYMLYFPLFLEQSFGASPFIIGIILSAMSVVTAIASSQMGRWAKVISNWALIKASFILFALAMAMIPFSPNLLALLIPTIVYGLGHGIMIPGLLTLLAESAPMKYRGAFMSINGMVLRLGQTLGPIVIGLVFGIWGIDATFYAGAGLSLAMYLILIVLVREGGRRRGGTEESDA